MEDNSENNQSAMHLILISPRTEETRFQILEGTNLLGRWDPDASAFPEIDLESADPEAKISRKHALIRRTGSSATIEDLGSLNGTLVNRQRLNEADPPRELKHGDEVVVGKTVLRFEISTSKG